MIFFSSPQNVFPFLLAHLLFFSLVHFFLFSFPCFHVSQMITPLNLPNCLYQPVYVGRWTPLEVRKPTAGGLPMPPGAGLGMKASRGSHGSSSWQQEPCSLQSKPVLHGSRQSRWLRLVVHPFNKAATGNITRPSPQDLAVEWLRQGACRLPWMTTQLFTSQLGTSPSMPTSPCHRVSHMKISLLGFYVPKHIITQKKP